MQKPLREDANRACAQCQFTLVVAPGLPDGVPPQADAENGDDGPDKGGNGVATEPRATQAARKTTFHQVPEDGLSPEVIEQRRTAQAQGPTQYPGEQASPDISSHLTFQR